MPEESQVLFYLTHVPPLSQAQLDRLCVFLPPERCARAAAYRRIEDRRTSVLVFLLLRYALFRLCGTTAMPPLVYDENGKPALPETGLHCSLSHCAAGVCCALDASPVGADIQDYRPVSDAVIRRVCSPSEREALSRSDKPEQLFAAFWTCKESLGKKNGAGLGYDLRATAFCPPDGRVQQTDDGLFYTLLTESCAVSVCSVREMPFVCVSWEELSAYLQEKLS